MRHAPFLKLISRELGDDGRMVDIGSLSICRCGRRFPTDEQLEAHTVRPITLLLSASEQTATNTAITLEPARVSTAQVEP
jgi:hypothetical protein